MSEPTAEPEAEHQPPYLVRLLIPSEATTPAAAVEDFIDSIVSFGLRGFTYRVWERATGKEYVVSEDSVILDDESPDGA